MHGLSQSMQMGMKAQSQYVISTDNSSKQLRKFINTISAIHSPNMSLNMW